jgi:NTE family protein
MDYHFKNLIFEGGGVKGIAYLGALEVLEAKGILAKIKRVGGTSAGAINAGLLALGYTRSEQDSIMKQLDFNKFMDGSWGFGLDSWRLLNNFGWYKGDFFRSWAADLVERKLGKADATFADLKAGGFRDLFICGTNLSTGLSEVFSFERTPKLPVADALRISMSIPLYFKAFKFNSDCYVDGGVLNNFPVKLFDQLKYIDPKDQADHALETEYYNKRSAMVRAAQPDASPFVYNRESLGFRLDSSAEIAVLRDGKAPVHSPIKNFFGFTKALIGTLMDSQDQQHLHSDDWQRTIYIDTLGVGTTEFNLSVEKKAKLIESGRNFTRDYFKWYDSVESQPVNKPETPSVARPA